MGLAWRLPPDDSLIEYFCFLPRFTIDSEKTRVDSDISQCEKELQEHTSAYQPVDIRSLYELREKQKMQTFSEFQKSLNEVFSEFNSFKPISTKEAISDDFLQMLEQFHLVHERMIKCLGE